MSATQMRFILIVFSIVVLFLIYWSGMRKKRRQGRRHERVREVRLEPILGDRLAEPDPGTDDSGEPFQAEFEMQAQPAAAAEGDAEVSIARARAAMNGRDAPGRRPDEAAPERIVSIFVVARNAEYPFRGPDIVVAAEKTGLEYGHLGIFHRLLEGKSEAGPVFSAASMVEPGAFDMAAIREMSTPGLTLFMTLPGPVSALDAWDAMLPTAQRLAELLDGLVVDDRHNALGRQRVAHLRDELRLWDRRHEIAGN